MLIDEFKLLMLLELNAVDIIDCFWLFRFTGVLWGMFLESGVEALDSSLDSLLMCEPLMLWRERRKTFLWKLQISTLSFGFSSKLMVVIFPGFFFPFSVITEFSAVEPYRLAKFKTFDEVVSFE
jgi:hypothetical protein